MPLKKPPAAPVSPPSVLPSAVEPARLLDRKGVAEALRIHERTLDQLVSSGGYPPPDLKLGSSPRWSVLTHNRWVESHLRPEE